MTRHIELDAPNISELEKESLSKCIDSGFVSTFGPFVSKFEKRIASFLRAGGAVSVQSGTAALHISLHELGIGKGDEVIVPALTFVATVNPVIYVGAKPIFIDVDNKTWNINPDEIKKNITKKTRAIIPVHIYGNPCDMNEIIDIAKKYRLYVVEDATQSLGARYNGKYTGTLGDLGCFSFNGNKIITTGGGGMVVGNSEKRLRHIKFLINQAKDEINGFYHSEIGFNYRMTNLEAALGLAQMKKAEIFLAKKQMFNKIYKEELREMRAIRFQEGFKNAKSSWWLTCIVFEEAVEITTLQKKLKHKNIPTRRIYMPITEFPPYRKYKRSACKNAYYIYERGLCLPSSTLNSEGDVRYVCKILKEVLRKGGF